MYYPKKSERDRTATVLLEIGNMMMSSGANTERIRVTLRRIASSWGYNLELMITHRALIMTLTDSGGEYAFSKIKRIGMHAVNFSMVSNISHMSWNVANGEWSVDQVVEEIERLKKMPHFNRWLVLLLVGLGDAAFCFAFGGDLVAMGITFIATVIGLLVKQEVGKKELNPYVVIFIGAFVASIISYLAFFIPACKVPDAAFATSVLYLIPGVPLVNSITDLIDGNIQNGVARGVNVFLISFAITFGLMLAKIFYSFFL